MLARLCWISFKLGFSSTWTKTFQTYAAKSLQSCPTLCDPTDSSPPGSHVPGILQARTLEWVAISFSNAWKWKVKVKPLGCVWLFMTQWTAAYQAPPMWFSRQEYWSGVPLPSPQDVINWIKKKQRNQGSNCQHLLGHRKSKGISEKKIYFCFTDYNKAFDCVGNNKLLKMLKEVRIPDHFIYLLRNL